MMGGVSSQQELARLLNGISANANRAIVSEALLAELGKGFFQDALGVEVVLSHGEALDLEDEESATDCEHPSSSGVDQYFGPGKVMECHSCGQRETIDW